MVPLDHSRLAATVLLPAIAASLIYLCYIFLRHPKVIHTPGFLLVHLAYDIYCLHSLLPEGITWRLFHTMLTPKMVADTIWRRSTALR